MSDETTSTGISLPAEVMALLDKQAKSDRRKRSQQIAWLVEQEESRRRAQFAPRTKTRQPVNA